MEITEQLNYLTQGVPNVAGGLESYFCNRWTQNKAIDWCCAKNGGTKIRPFKIRFNPILIQVWPASNWSFDLTIWHNAASIIQRQVNDIKALGQQGGKSFPSHHLKRTWKSDDSAFLPGLCFRLCFFCLRLSLWGQWGLHEEDKQRTEVHYFQWRKPRVPGRQSSRC